MKDSSSKTVCTATPLSAVTHNGGTLYTVESASKEGIEYTVDLSIGMCGCVSGNTGSVCKHQLAASQHSAVRLPQVHTCTPAERAVNDEFFSLIGFTSRLIYFHFFVCMKLMIFVTIRMDRSVGNGYYRSVN